MMKSLFAIIIMVMAVVIFSPENVVACGESQTGMVGLEIDGGSYVGMQGYMGSSTTRSREQNCIASSKTITHQNFVGVGLMTSANGAVCLSKTGRTPGYVEGSGTFEAGVEGSICGIDFYSYSTVEVHGRSGGFHN